MPPSSFKGFSKFAPSPECVHHGRSATPMVHSTHAQDLVEWVSSMYSGIHTAVSDATDKIGQEGCKCKAGRERVKES